MEKEKKKKLSEPLHGFAEKKVLISKKEDISSVFDLTPASFVILNKEAVVDDVNNAALSLLNKKKEEMLCKRFGNSFNCIESTKDERGCGYWPLCSDCELRKAITSAFEDNAGSDDIDLAMRLITGGKESVYYFRTKVTPVNIDGEKKAAVSLFDITDKINREIVLIESRDYCNNLLDQIPALVWRINENLECEYVNKAWQNYTGLSFEDALGKGLVVAIHPEDVDYCIKAVNEAGRNRTSFQIMNRLLRYDGEYRWCMVEGNPYYDLKGNFAGYIGINHDITDKRLLVNKLEENEELFRTIFEQSPVGITYGQSDFEISYVNPMFEKIMGRTKEELKGLKWTDITHPDDIQKDLDCLEKLKAGEIESYSMNKRYIKPDGSEIWTHMTISPIRISKNPEITHICILKDISESIKIENELKESERSKAMLLSNLPGMAYRCKYDRDWTMLFVSDGCFDLTGYKPESLLYNRDLSFNDIINPEYQTYLYDKWTEILKKKSVLKEEYAITTASGEIKWVFEQGRGVYDENGEVIALEGIIIDISGQKKREEDIRYLNNYDVLSGLYNRRFFEEEIKRIDTDEHLPLSIIIADINGLKITNDALGHDAGDKTIRATAEILKSCIRKGDILARTGGDEFSILLPRTNQIEANNIVKRIKTLCDEYNRKSIKEVHHLSTSLGYSTKLDNETALNSIIKEAEDNMYRDKLLQSKSLHSSIISSMKKTLYEKSQETEEHAQRLIKLSCAIGKKMKLMDKQINELKLLSTLHDIGKIGISDAILNKSDKLTDEEWVIMKKHPEIGYRIAMSTPELQLIADYILCHHERWDGNGYPNGLAKEQIPLLSRIISVVDAYDAMTEDRSYSKAKTKDAAIEEIRKNAGSQFDPYIAKLFIEEIV